MISQFLASFICLKQYILNIETTGPARCLKNISPLKSGGASICQMIVLDILGLGVPEMVVVLIAIVLLIEPKNMVYIKPLVKAAYKAWLSYRSEVEKAQSEMSGVRQSMMEPILSAKREAEAELASSARKEKGLAESIKADLKEARSEIESARRTEEAGKRGVSRTPAEAGAEQGKGRKKPEGGGGE